MRRLLHPLPGRVPLNMSRQLEPSAGARAGHRHCHRPRAAPRALRAAAPAHDAAVMGTCPSIPGVFWLLRLSWVWGLVTWAKVASRTGLFLIPKRNFCLFALQT